MDRPIDAASAHQPTIRRVDDGIDLLERNIALVKFERLAVNLDTHHSNPL